MPQITGRVSAWLSDRIGRKPVMLTGGLLSLASALTMFSVTIQDTVTSINVAVLIGCAATGVMFGPRYTFFAEQFPRHERQSGVGFAFHVGGVLGGGISHRAPSLRSSLTSAANRRDRG